MSSLPVAAIFDIGRTNKKFILFDRDYHVVKEVNIVIPDIKDEDGDACEDLNTVCTWMSDQLNSVLSQSGFKVEVVNFSGHGASLVHIDKEGKPVTPFYDYMKPLQDSVCEGFYHLFGGKESFSRQTGSPALNMLNSGIQLYWLKNYKPALFTKIKTSLHLPQYFNFLFSGKSHADITSIGCHTGLWDFKKKQYHSWLEEEKVSLLLPPAESAGVFDRVNFNGKHIPVGIGIHDSSSALLPFVYAEEEPFVMLSSGTWNIALNPFFKGELREEDYAKDCLYYLVDIGHKVGSSRLFLGNECDYQVKKLEAYFNKQKGYFKSVRPDKDLIKDAIKTQSESRIFYPQTMAGTGPFPDLKGPYPDLSQFYSFDAAYHKMILDITFLQKTSIELVSGNIKRLYVSGGFLKNELFMELLQAFLTDWELFTIENKRASALGAAIVLHDLWHSEPLSKSISPGIPFKSSIKLALKMPAFISNSSNNSIT